MEKESSEQVLLESIRGSTNHKSAILDGEILPEDQRRYLRLRFEYLPTSWYKYDQRLDFTRPRYSLQPWSSLNSIRSLPLIVASSMETGERFSSQLVNIKTNHTSKFLHVSCGKGFF